MLSEALDAIEDGEEIELTSILTQINLALDAAQNNQSFQMSWHKLMSGQDDTDQVYREFIVLQPLLDYSSLLPAESAMQRLHTLTEQLGIEKNIGIRIRLTGSAALSHEEMLSVTTGTEIAMVLALCMVTVIMIFGLGSLRLVFATLVTLVVGLILTAAFAALAVGTLNMISVAFAVLYIGLGVDFAIHYCLRYRELRYDGSDNDAAIKISSTNTGSSMFLCALTTATGFFAFIPTDYDGVAELGLISGVGMFISLLVTLTLLPAILSFMPVKPKPKQELATEPAKAGWILALPITHARKIKLISSLLVLTLLGLTTQVRFDHNTLNLQDPNNE